MKKIVGKKVFVIGSSATEYTLAKKMSALDKVAQVFVAPGNDAMKEFCTIIDIREHNIQELLEFVLENDIDLTIASSELAIKNNIASIFQRNNQMIFAPTRESSSICLSKSDGKKFMYKTRIPCPKFGIFDKASLAIDYVRNSSMPIVLKSDEHLGNTNVFVGDFFSLSKRFIENIFDRAESRVIIENYIFGHEFSFYVITDGYHSLPLGSVATYKHELEGDGGLITSGMGSFAPDYKISQAIEKRILQQIIYPTLNTLARQQTPYVGILGVDLIMNDNGQLFVIEYNSFLKSPDAQCILSLLNENLYDLFEACVVGAFADDYNEINILDNYVVSCVLSGRKSGVIINGLDDLDENSQIAYFKTKKNAYLEYETIRGRNIILTRMARVLSRAIVNLYEDISVINFDGMKYRRDIGRLQNRD